MKNKIVKQLLGISVATILFAHMPILSLAADYDIGDGSIIVDSDADGVRIVTQDGVQNERETTETVITGTSTSNTITINSSGTGENAAKVTIRDLNIDVSNTGDSNTRPRICGETAIKTTGVGNVDIELDGTNTLKSGCLCAGLQKENGGTLTIKDEDPSQNDIPDSLTASGSIYAAGIGGGDYKDGNDIVIEGGTVTANGGSEAAGIGGGFIGNGTVKICGGTVIATGGNGGAGIGGGSNEPGTVRIYGGNVTATGGRLGAGIGGGVGGTGTVEISGGTVIATGGEAGPGIGGGCSSGDINRSSLTVSGDASVKAAAGGSDSYGLYGIGAAVGDGGSPNGEEGAFKDPVVLDSFTGSVIYYKSGTSAQSMIDHPDLNIDPLHHFSYKIKPEGSVIILGGVPEQNNDNDTSDNSNDSDETPPYQGITSDMLTRQINSLMRTSKTGAVTIDFGRNICLSPALMKVLFETGNVAKNCTFTYMGKRYNMYIPVIDIKSEKYKDAMEELKKEDNNSGFAGFMRTKDIFIALGVTVEEIE